MATRLSRFYVDWLLEKISYFHEGKLTGCPASVPGLSPFSKGEEENVLKTKPEIF